MGGLYRLRIDRLTRSKSRGYIFSALLFFLFTACNERDEPIPVNPEHDPTPEWNVIKTFTSDDFLTLMEKPKFSWIRLIIGHVHGKEQERLHAVKVTYYSPHPKGGIERIPMSGLLLLPPNTDSSCSHRLLLTLPYTYLFNRQTSTQQIINYNPDQLEAFVLFGLLQASRGYIVLMPDYPGFGASFGRCTNPYVERRPMIRATMDFIHASLYVLDAMHYRHGSTLTITGYSLGAYVATQTAREIEMSEKISNRLSIDMLTVGGTPCDLVRIADKVKTADHLPTPYLLPLALHGYLHNGYSKLPINRILKSPYASLLDSCFDGCNENCPDTYPYHPSDLFTESFIHGNEDSIINAVLRENSLTPWNNRCTFVMLHGASDQTVYLDNASTYAKRHNASGGHVNFREIPGNHKEAGILFYIHLLLNLPQDQ